MSATVFADTADPLALAERDSDALVALIDGCANPGVNRSVLIVTLATLPPAFARPHHLRLVAQAIDPLLGLDRARLFRLADGNLVFTWRGDGAAPDDNALIPVAPVPVAPVRAAIAALARLFDDLPADGQPMTLLLDLPRDAELVTATITRSVAIAAIAPAPPGRALDPSALAALEAALAQADVAHFSRRKPVCIWPAGEAPTLAWEKRTLSISRIALVLAPGTRPQSDPWLFRRLTRTLDMRMLALLCDPAELRRAGPFALDLNVASVLAPEFLRFDAALPSRLRGEVLLNLLPADILSDPAAFEFARDFARARGYRLLLRGITAGWMTVLPADLLGVDQVQLRATPELLGLAQLPDCVRPENVVLTGVASLDALEWGRRRGILLFEGPMIRPGR